MPIVSPAEEGRTPDGTIFGSTSGQVILNMNKVIQDKYTIPYAILTISNYEVRNYCILLLGIHNYVTMLSTANPSTLILIAKQGNEWKRQLINDTRTGTLTTDLDIPDDIRKIVESRITAKPAVAERLEQAIESDPEKKLRPKHYWNKLKLITCWTGGNSNVFLRDVKLWFGDVKTRDLGYLASEVRGSIPLSCQDNSGILTVGENFFEFVKVSDIDQLEPTFYMADELEVGERYYIFFTTKSGLYRYNINDIVKVTGYMWSTPKIIFEQKGKGVTNITGEKLYEQQLLSAVELAEQKTGLKTEFYVCRANAEVAQYEFYVEFEQKDLTADEASNFVKCVDQGLSTINIEYDTKRKSLRLMPMRLFSLGDASLEKYKRWRVANGIREAQFKITPLVSDASFLEPLEIIQLPTATPLSNHQTNTKPVVHC